MADTKKLSVLVLGAGGNFGPSIMAALLERKADFSRIRVLTSPERVKNFSHFAEKGIEVLGGELTDAQHYQGMYSSLYIPNQKQRKGRELT